MEQAITHVQIHIRGAVQGVGFRPFIYRLALELGVRGWVNNSSQGVTIDAEADAETLRRFEQRIQTELPPHAAIDEYESHTLPVHGYLQFEIHHSDADGAKTARVLPDLATCPDCLRELFDPADRRYRYPFINCTHCGPRYSIIEALPYDRPNTTMRGFQMCDTCRAEYENPLDRRFHAQPVACPVCGPHLALWNRDGAVLAVRDAALIAAADALRAGQVVALKGLGGYQLLVDARNAGAVNVLRARKRRREKPFAVMLPTLDSVRAVCDVSPLEADLLTGTSAPIVLLRRRESRAIAGSVAPENPYLGVMLPYTPLHHLLMHEIGFPMIATSGNRSGEPICITESEALDRLGDLADVFLVHDRPITRHVDDSIVRVVGGRVMMMRRARGYAPEPIMVSRSHDDERVILAVGAHQKNTVAVLRGSQLTLSQHIGDLETAETYRAFERVIEDVSALYGLTPDSVACDLHPDYLSTQHAASLGLPLLRVQHHAAHVLACMAEHHLGAPVFGLAWDGTGYGTDGTVWGGEGLIIDAAHRFHRTATFYPFRLAGGDAATREPRRSALGLLAAVYGDAIPTDSPTVHAFSDSSRRLLLEMITRGLNAPLTSSVGRLFDAVASLTGLRHDSDYEGGAAMQVEFAAMRAETEECYPYLITDITDSTRTSDSMIDVRPMVMALVADVRAGLAVSEIAAKFHNTLAAVGVDCAIRAGLPDVVLAGGCFQNKTLTERLIQRLSAAGFRVHWHQQIPPNDGSIAAGQALAALFESQETKGQGDVSGSTGKDSFYSRNRPT